MNSIEKCKDFMDKDEIVIDVVIKLSKELKNDLLITAKNDLIMYHSSFGQDIRNYYRLWEEENPYTDFLDGRSDVHPDNMSFKIIEEVHDNLTKKFFVESNTISDDEKFIDKFNDFKI